MQRSLNWLLRIIDFVIDDQKNLAEQDSHFNKLKGVAYKLGQVENLAIGKKSTIKKLVQNDHLIEW